MLCGRQWLQITEGAHQRAACQAALDTCTPWLSDDRTASLVVAYASACLSAICVTYQQSQQQPSFKTEHIRKRNLGNKASSSAAAVCRAQRYVGETHLMTKMHCPPQQSGGQITMASRSQQVCERGGGGGGGHPPPPKAAAPAAAAPRLWQYDQSRAAGADSWWRSVMGQCVSSQNMIGWQD
jgi:hypothetical protein